MHRRVSCVPCVVSICTWPTTSKYKKPQVLTIDQWPHRRNRGGLFNEPEQMKDTAVHRRRIYTEDKVKVVAAVRGTTFNPFLATLAIFHQDNLKNRTNASFSHHHPGAIHPFLHISSWYKTASAARNFPQTAATTHMSCLLYKAFFYAAVSPIWTMF